MLTNNELWVYGANCCWHGSIDKTAKMFAPGSNHPLPCCPHCGGMLYQIPKTQWIDMAKTYAEQHKGYLAFMEWTGNQDKCWPDIEDAKKAYHRTTGHPVSDIN